MSKILVCLVLPAKEILKIWFWKIWKQLRIAYHIANRTMPINIPEMLIIHLLSSMNEKKYEILKLKPAAYMTNTLRLYAHPQIIWLRVTRLDYRIEPWTVNHKKVCLKCLLSFDDICLCCYPLALRARLTHAWAHHSPIEQLGINLLARVVRH